MNCWYVIDLYRRVLPCTPPHQIKKITECGLIIFSLECLVPPTYFLKTCFFVISAQTQFQQS